MNYKKVLIIGAIAVVLIIVASVLLDGKNRFGMSGIIVSDYYRHSTTTVPTYPTSSNISAKLVSRNQDREYLELCNTLANNPIIWLTATSVTTSIAVNKGWALYPPTSTAVVGSNCRVWQKDDNLYLGDIYGIALVTTTITIIEK